MLRDQNLKKEERYRSSFFYAVQRKIILPIRDLVLFVVYLQRSPNSTKNITYIVRIHAMCINGLRASSTLKMKNMDVYYTIVQNTSLNGMPIWFKATSLLLFSVIVSLIVTMYTMLFIEGPDMVIRFGY